MSSTATHNTFKAPCKWRSSTPGPTLHGNDYSGTSSQDPAADQTEERSSTSSAPNPETSTSWPKPSMSTTASPNITFAPSKITISSSLPASVTNDSTSSHQKWKLTCTFSTRYATRYNPKKLRSRGNSNG